MVDVTIIDPVHASSTSNKEPNVIGYFEGAAAAEPVPMAREDAPSSAGLSGASQVSRIISRRSSVSAQRRLHRIVRLGDLPRRASLPTRRSLHFGLSVPGIGSS